MPLYDYRCRQCNEVTEVRHGFKESFEDPCPKCGGEMARVFNAAGIVFKGSGFYVTDSRKSSEGGAVAKSDGSSSAKSDGNSSAKSEASSSAKSEGTSPAKSESGSPAKSESPASSSPKSETAA